MRETNHVFLDHLEALSEKDGERLTLRLATAKALYRGLLASYQNHLTLGGKGKEIVKEEADKVMTHLRADLESELKMLEEIDRFGRENSLAINVWGEEIKRGEQKVGSKNSSKKAFWVMDGLDGTANYSDKADWPYGPLLAASNHPDPKYKDFEVAGVGLPEEGWLLMAVKEVGVYLVDIKDNSLIRIKAFNEDEKFDAERILADDYFDEAKKIIGKRAKVWPRTGSTAATVAAMAIGKAKEDFAYPIMNKGWQGLVDVTRKRNLELPAIYLITTELGGFMVNQHGVSFARALFKKRGQFDEEGNDIHEPFFLVKNKQTLFGIFETLGLVLTKKEKKV